MPTEPGEAPESPDSPRPRAKEAPPDLALLKFLATQGGSTEFVYFSSRELGRALGVPQQTGSARILAALEQAHLTRRMAGRKQGLRLTDAGATVLRGEYADYQRIFEDKGSIRLHGKIRSGLGEGGYYISQPEYSRQFKEQLGYTPYPGTLNIGLDATETARYERLGANPGLPIGGFARDGRTFGGARCFRADLQGESVAIIMPDRTHHANTLELLSPHYLRDRLTLKDGDKVEVIVAP